MKTFFWVFVCGIYHLVLPDPTFEQIEEIAANGGELVWDSAPSQFLGAQYAAQVYGAPVPADCA